MPIYNHGKQYELFSRILKYSTNRKLYKNPTLCHPYFAVQEQSNELCYSHERIKFMRCRQI